MVFVFNFIFSSAQFWRDQNHWFSIMFFSLSAYKPVDDYLVTKQPDD